MDHCVDVHDLVAGFAEVPEGNFLGPVHRLGVCVHEPTRGEADPGLAHVVKCADDDRAEVATEPGDEDAHLTVGWSSTRMPLAASSIAASIAFLAGDCWEVGSPS